MDIKVELGLVREATARLLADLGTLDEVSLAAPSRLDGRSRRDLIHHLAADARSRAGAEPPSDVAAADAIADLAAACDYLADTWAVRSPDSWGRRLDGMRRGPSRLMSEPAARLVEVAVHHVDLDIGLEPQDWSAQVVDVVLDHVMAALAQQHSRVRGPASSWRLHRTDTEEGIGADWVLIRAPYGTEIHPTPGEADTTIAGSGHALVTWVTGRGPLADAGLEVTGDATLAAELPSTYPY